MTFSWKGTGKGFLKNSGALMSGTPGGGGGTGRGGHVGGGQRGDTLT